jgi:ribosomal protein L11 methyltransferase
MFELLMLAPQDCVENVSDALMDELEALSVSVEDADANTEAEQAWFGEPGMPPPPGGWQRSVVRALFSVETLATEAAALLLAQDWAQGLQLESVLPVADQDWVRLTQSQFAPVPITPDFWIVPSWHALPPEAKRVIRLDPGLAFGTGTHPTTRMCLRWTAQHAALLSTRWSRVLDYGCGSGILAIAAALHGAIQIDAVDIDPAAVEATRANALVNLRGDSALGAGLSCAGLNAGLPELANGTYALVYANILTRPLKLLAPLLCQHVAAGGDLVLAGILDRQTDELKAAYAPWLQLEVSDSEDGWSLMTAHRSHAG